MTSPFLFRLRVECTKDGKSNRSGIPIYAFKGGNEKSLCPEDSVNLDTLKMITDMAYGARTLTVYTNFAYSYQDLESREINYFEPHVKENKK